MELKLARHLWGVTEPWETVFPKIKAAGYAFVELYRPEWSDAERGRLLDLTSRHGLGVILQGITTGQSVAEHVASFRKFIDYAVQLNAQFLNIHSGSDAFSDADADAFYGEVTRIEKDLPLPVSHETHRGRVFFNPWRTRDVLLKFPTLKLCCDFSHWVCVAERLEWDDPDGSILKLCADRALHLHARVGYQEGPQVPDPRAPEYADPVERHFQWWQTIWAAQAARNMQACTATPEFGPAGYLHTLPYTNVPVADLWSVCEWMTGQLRQRFGR